MRIFLLSLLVLATVNLYAQVTITVNAGVESRAFSKYIYGKNNSLSDNPGSPLSNAEWTRIRESGLTFLRENGGNNATKYNWRRKLTSHPDWYNNVYAHDWDFAVQSLQQNLPDAQGMWSFQLIGKAAKTTAANFNDWAYNSSQWWSGVGQNLAGGGTVNAAGGGQAQVEGNPDLYLENWTADSTVGILDQWFVKQGLNKNTLRYWNMDNEVEIWNGTHDDIMPEQIAAEEFMQRYFEVAKKARAKFPGIALAGPVTANEWQWYNWGDGITIGGKFYPWLEYFIKRVAEEQQASGVRLLDVLDIHFYPGSTKPEEVVQFHRVYFDETYVFPEANGVKTVNGGWDNSQNKEYIFGRCRQWLDQYMGAGHGVTFGVSETGISSINASTTAVWYAGTLGEFMRHPEVELFSPWHWYPAMWEVLHLYSRYNKSMYVPSASSNEELVSAYPTINAAGDSLTVVLVNRSVSSTQSVQVSFNGFDLANESFTALKLSNLPAGETFVSHTTNALQKSSVGQVANKIDISLAPMSITTLQLKGTRGEVVTAVEDQAERDKAFKVYPNPAAADARLTYEINRTGNAVVDLIDLNGRVVKRVYNGRVENTSFKSETELQDLSKGAFIMRLNLNGQSWQRKVFVY